MALDTRGSRLIVSLVVALSWTVFEHFASPKDVHSWNDAAVFVEAAERASGRNRSELARLRALNDVALADIGGDPSADDWRLFRPLRRDREEDWSDWLGELLASSSTGRFAHALLGRIESRTPGDYVGAVAAREVSHEGHRADLIIEWCDATYTHIEVKVGDPNLEKTIGTAGKVEALMRPWGRPRSDVLLLLPSQQQAWAALCATHPDWPARVRELSWQDVATALRPSLLPNAGESTTWRVWARTFCGAIEQELLGWRSGGEAESWSRVLSLRELGSVEEALLATGAK